MGFTTYPDLGSSGAGGAGGDTMEIYSDEIAVGAGNITITAAYADAAGSGLGDTIMTCSNVVINSTSDLVFISWNFQTFKTGSPTMVMGIQSGSDTPVFLHQAFSPDATDVPYSGVFLASELSLSAGTSDIKLLGSRSGGTSWSVYDNSNIHKARFSIVVVDKSS